MIKLIIVEDEPLMNEYIVNCLDYGSLGIELCGHFFNGKSAYEFLNDNEADIVVTDIQMPVMDGLTLIAQTAEKHPNTKFIVLSNFDDFQMVKQAFKYGATDYILKTEFEPKLFKKILLELIGQKLPKQTDKMSVAVREVTLKQFFWDEFKGNLADNMRIKADGNLFVTVVKLINYDDIIKTQWNTEKELMKFGLSNCLNETLEAFGDGEFFFNDYDEIIFILSSSVHGPSQKETKDMFATVFDVLSRNFSLTAAAGICDKTCRISLKEQYLLATQALPYYFLYGKDKLIPYSRIAEFNDTPDIPKLIKELDSTLAAFKFDELCKLLQELINIKPAFACISSIRDFYKTAIELIMKTCETYDVTQAQQLLTNVNAGYDTAIEINNAIISACEILSAVLTHSDIAIMQIKNYIYKNYSQNITLQFLAKEFLFNYSDLSRRFRKATGMSFSKFLIDLRLTEAMKLIETTDFRCSHIATMVGYNNYENFSRAFKNKYKKWPNEIRKADKP